MARSRHHPQIAQPVESSYVHLARDLSFGEPSTNLSPRRGSDAAVNNSPRLVTTSSRRSSLALETLSQHFRSHSLLAQVDVATLSVQDQVHERTNNPPTAELAHSATKRLQTLASVPGPFQDELHGVLRDVRSCLYSSVTSDLHVADGTQDIPYFNIASKYYEMFHAEKLSRLGEVDRLNNIIEEYQHSASSSQTQIERLHKALLAAITERDSFELRSRTTETELSSLKADHAKMTSKMDMLAVENTFMSNQSEQLKRQLDTEISTSKDLEEARQDEAERCEKLLKLVAFHEKQATDLRQSYNELLGQFGVSVTGNEEKKAEPKKRPMTPRPDWEGFCHESEVPVFPYGVNSTNARIDFLIQELKRMRLELRQTKSNWEQTKLHLDSARTELALLSGKRPHDKWTEKRNPSNTTKLTGIHSDMSSPRTRIARSSNGDDYENDGSMSSRLHAGGKKNSKNNLYSEKPITSPSVPLTRSSGSKSSKTSPAPATKRKVILDALHLPTKDQMALASLESSSLSARKVPDVHSSLLEVLRTDLGTNAQMSLAAASTARF
eukprot:GILK01005675.1.p1 GENE.GILK01005675.1~~GILK01005675.1.p1  ORF type:complete len:554 (+),score=81.83 GILK01005675.1:72-1733(+)